MAITLLRAGPGAGKTTALVQRAAQAIDQQGIPCRQVLFVVHDSLAARRVRIALDAALGRPLPIMVVTYEGLALRILEESRGYGQRALLDPVAERLAVAEAIAWTHGSARRLRERETKAPSDDLLRNSSQFRDDIADFIAELKRCKLDTTTFRHHIIPGLPQQDELLDIADIYEAYQKRLESSEMFDYRGVIWLALLALQGEAALVESLRSRWPLILADDLQDATALELELLTALLSEQSELVGAYEPAQCIYRFRGAVQNPVTLLEALAVGHEVRCQTVSSSIHNSDTTVSQVATVAERFARVAELDSASVTTVEGEVELQIHRTLQDELLAVGDEIIASLEVGQSPTGIAVIARGHREVAAAEQSLLARRIPVAGSQPRLGRWAASELLQDILTVHQYMQDRQRLIELAVLHHRRVQANAAAARIVTFGAAPAGRSVAIAQCIHQADRKGKFVLDEGIGNIVGADDSDFAWLREALTEADADNVVELLRRTVQQAGFARRMSPSDADRVMVACLALLEKLQEADGALRRVADRGLSPADTHAAVQMLPEPEATEDGVAILTAHDARGRHFEQVFVIAVNEDIFPAPPVISRLLNRNTIGQLRQRVAEHLGPDTQSLTFAGFGEQPNEALAEEQRIFYLCLTRATRRLVISCHLEQDGSQAAPSEFFLELVPDTVRHQIALAATQAEARLACPLAGDAPAASDHTCTYALMRSAL